MLWIEEKFKDIKEVIRIRKSKDRQYNGQMKNNKKDKQRSTNSTQKTKDQQQTEGERCEFDSRLNTDRHEPY